MQRCFCQNSPKQEKGSLIWQQYLLPSFAYQDCYASLGTSHWRRCDFLQLGVSVIILGIPRMVVLLVFWLAKQRFQATNVLVAQNMVWMFILLKVCAAGSQSHDNHDSKGTPRVSVAIISVKQLILQLMFFLKWNLGWLQQRTSLFEKGVVSPQCSSCNVQLVMFWFICF